jgi:hypothetical protein
MKKITALLLASTTLSLHATPLPTRSDIFNSVIHSRPAISASGKWIASTSVSDGKLRVFPMAGGAPRNLGLPAGVHGQWYRWASERTDALLISVGTGKRSDLYLFDVEAGALTRVTDDSYTPAFSLGTHANNYAFTYERYKKGDEFHDLSPNGSMVQRRKASAHLPGYLAKDERYFQIAPGQAQWTFTAGASEATRGTVLLMPQDLRHAGGLMSISNDGTAWILSSAGRDTVALFSIDTSTGARRSVAQAPVDIGKVILDPLTLAPDFVDYETTEPKRILLNPRVAPDM